MKKTKYGSTEIIALSITFAAVALIMFFLRGLWRLPALAPALMFCLVAYYASVPDALKAWKNIAHYMFMPVSVVLLTLGFVFGVGFTSLFARLFRVKLLDAKSERRDSYWVEKTAEDKTLEKIQRPF